MREFIIAVLLGLAVDVTSGQRSIQLIPQHPVIDGAVTLRVTGITEQRLNFTWYKGPNTNAKYLVLGYFPGSSDSTVTRSPYDSRITAFTNGSLQIKDLQITDGGYYIVKTQTVSAAQNIYVTLTVYDRSGNYCIVGLALGLISAISLGVVGSFYLYNKLAAKRLNESLKNIPEDIEVYENVQDLELQSEEVYTELKTYDIPSILTQEYLCSIEVNDDLNQA
ncbi:carcinoembryonic antigen-related cell adhesion molecule 3-like [Eleutherodactylus coqui]|uniref:carcinoembryonic antigen-related cell adhesion molecule 3-like n=1 Tax=Eleutherodactylus coqui TaxID=57060 RepID=UPI003462A632